MTRSHCCVLALASAGVLSIVALGCDDPPPPAPIVEPPPPVVELDAGVVELAPLIEDAGEDADASEVGPKKGSGLSVNQSRAKQCCNALRAQAAPMTAGPEKEQIKAAAAMCDTFAMQLGATSGPKSPELEPIRQFLKGRTLPSMCQ